MAIEIVYFTAATKEDALRIGRLLVEECLAACVNVLGEIASVYRWEGEVQQETEIAAILKTKSELVERVINRVKEGHKYDCPCVVSWPVSQGNPEFLEWVHEETGGKV